MTEVGHTDLSRLLQSKRNECSAIVTSRKRKLRELFAVATQSEGLPEDAFANPDAPAATAAEWQFLQATDVLQGKQLNEANIPPRPKISLDILKRSLAKVINAASDHRALPVPIPGANRQDTPAGKVESPSSQASLLKAVDAASSTRTSASPIPHINRRTTQSPLSTGQSSNGTPIPPPASAYTPPVEGNTKLVNGVANGAAGATEEAHRRTAQVTFPPGTKGSPSTEAAQVVASAGGSADAVTKLPSPTVGAGSAPPRTEGSEPATARLVAEASKASEALSSPGSTAQSATTPAVHDVSTDTSPDNDGHHFSDSNEQKPSQGQGQGSGDEPQQDASQAQEAVAGVDDQFLQESIRSSAAVASPDHGTPVASAATTSDATKPSPPDTTRPAHDATGAATAAAINTPRPIPGPDGAHVSPTDTSAPAAEAEVPDSQDNSPDQMDVDVIPAPLAPETQSTLSPRELNIPTHNTPASLHSAKAIPKDASKAPERAVTRVSSGAMRLKSVTEIVGGTPRLQNPHERSTIRGSQDQLTPVTSTPQSPSRNRHLGHKRDRSKGQISTVVFGKQAKRMDDKTVVPGQKETFQPSDDYYTPLFVQNFTGATNWMQPIEKILFHANKTIATPDAHLAIRDHQACKVLRRVYHLQQHDKWSLRQPKRCPEPTRSASQWDVLLQEAKWMRTDFREERKWKMSAARNMAYACVEWIEGSAEERKALQVPAVIPPKSQAADDVAMGGTEEDNAENQPTPDLVSSKDVDSPQNMDELTEEFPETVAPSAIFTLQEDDLVFGLQRTPAADQLLEELPMYGSPLKVPKFDLTGSDYDPDAHWRRPALPLSKYVEGQMKVLSEGPPRKRSRFNYKAEESDDDVDGDFVADQLAFHAQVPPTTNEVALFNPETKHIRDRLHAGHQFRPPSEHAMPTQNFYECRSPSQWTVVEDDELRGLVREYSYNWSLISTMLTTRSLFTSGAERRTPWECFERWINLEGLPSDMQKTQYFKAYNSRIEAAQRVIAQQNQLAAQQATAAGGAITPVRRRQSTPLRVERRRNQKHLTLIDAMRKLAKKRETTLQKQQHNASQNNTVKKTNDAMSQRPTKTPRDYSLLRWERDQALAEKMAQYAQRQEAQRRAALQARAQGHSAQAAANGQAAGAGAAAAQAGQPGNHAAAANGMNGGSRPNIPSQLAAAAAAAARQGQRPMSMQGAPNGMVAGAVPSQMNGGHMPSAQVNGAPQAQMQGMQGQHRMPVPNPQPDANVMLRAQRISEQQRAAVQMQVQQQQQQQVGAGVSGAPNSASQQGSPPNMRNGVNHVNQQSFINNAHAMMAQFNTTNGNGNGHATSPLNGLHAPAVPNGSPGPRVQQHAIPNLVSQLNRLEAQFREKNPNMTPEQARQLATEHLTRAMMAQRQSAMNAAAGGSGQPGIANSIAATTSPHQYAALLRQQQQAQQAQAQQPPAPNQTAASASPGQAHQRQSSGSATPSAGK